MKVFEAFIKDVFEWRINLSAKLLIIACFMVTTAYIINLLLNKAKNQQLKKIKMAVTSSAMVVVWYFVVVARVLLTEHFHLFAATVINMTYTMGVLIGVVWLIKKPSSEPLILLMVLQILSLLLNAFALAHLALEHETSMIIVAVFLKLTALYYLIKAIPKVKGLQS